MNAPNSKRHAAKRRVALGALSLLFLSVPIQATAVAWIGQTEERVLNAHLLFSEMLDPLLKQPVERVRINGAEFALVSGATTWTTEQVEAAVSASCQRSRGQKTHSTRLKRGASEVLMLSLCPAAALDVAGARRMLHNFSRTGSLTAFGDWTAIYVHGTHEGSRLLAWTPTGELSPATMLAAEGDAPGADLPGIPRPTGRRILCATVGDRPLLAVYRTAQASLSDYATSLRADGYSVRAPPGSTDVLMGEHLGRTHLVVQVSSGQEHLLVVALLR